ncbi:MAG: N-6 DNA methylase [Pseudomonadota bacterium]
MSEFKQFYTTPIVSKLLVSTLTTQNPRSCLELSAGEGALIDAVLNKYPNVLFTAIDIDAKNYFFLKEKYANHNILLHNSLHSSLLENINNKFDIAVCNPPFSYIENSDHIRFIINKILNKDLKTKKIRTEIFFFCLNLYLLKSQGQLSIILPDLFLKSIHLKWFRESLSKNYTINKIIECAHKSFSKTEAKTHLYSITNKKPNLNNKITLINNRSEYLLTIADYINDKSYYFNRLIDNSFILFRGNLSGKKCRESNSPYFHTTSFSAPEHYNEKEWYNNTKTKMAISNDILIARVGSRVLGKTQVFHGKSAVISDCIFCLRIIDSKLREYILNRWLCEREDWLSKNSKGTCAKHFTLSDFRSLIVSYIVQYNNNL